MNKFIPIYLDETNGVIEERPDIYVGPELSLTFENDADALKFELDWANRAV